MIFTSTQSHRCLEGDYSAHYVHAGLRRIADEEDGCTGTQRLLKDLRKAYPPGTHGKIGWTRDGLYEGKEFVDTHILICVFDRTAGKNGNGRGPGETPLVERAGVRQLAGSARVLGYRDKEIATPFG